MSVVIDVPRASALDRSGPAQDSIPVPHADGLDPVIAAARAAGRRAGERLALTPLTPRQRAAVADARAEGVTWARIGDALGVTHQAVIKRYRKGGDH